MNSRAIEALEHQRAKIAELKTLHHYNERLTGWRASTANILQKLGVKEYIEAFKHIRYSSMITYIGGDNDFHDMEAYHDGLKRADSFLTEVIEQLKDFPEFNTPSHSDTPPYSNSPSISIQMIQVANQITQASSVTEILNRPEFSSLPSSQRQELKEQIEALNSELAKDHPKWDVIKRILSWALSFGRDVFFQVLPYILAKSDAIS